MSTGSQHDPSVGRVLANQYRVESLLGEGGMGAVYRGVQLSVNRPVAIKLIRPSISDSKEHVQRFRLEAEVMSKLEHPSIVRLYDFGLTDDGLLYLVMELLSGRELSVQLNEHGAMPPLRALRLGLRILNALRKPHELGIIHRDLKPANIFLTELDGDRDFVKIMDFGLARLHDNENRLTKAGEVMGTPAYMSPEQAKGDPVDSRADLYAVGIMLFVMLTGRIPFESGTAMGILAQHVTDPPPRLRDVAPSLVVNDSVQELLDRLLAKSPSDRPATAADAAALVHRALTASAGHEPVAVQTPHPPPDVPPDVVRGRESNLPRARLQSVGHLPPAGRRRSLLIAAAALAVLAVGGGIAVVAASGDDDDAPAELAAPADSVMIATTPSGAELVFDGATIGKTPYRFEFREETELEVKLDGHHPSRVRLSPGGNPTVVIALEKIVDDQPALASKQPLTITNLPKNRAAGKTRNDPNAPPPITSPPAVTTIDPYPLPTTKPPVKKKPIAKDPARKPGAPLVDAETPVSKPPSNAESRSARRKRLQREGPGYNNVAAADAAYRSGKISRIEYEDIVWVLKRYLKYKVRDAKERLQKNEITKPQYKQIVAEAKRFYREGKR